MARFSYDPIMTLFCIYIPSNLINQLSEDDNFYRGFVNHSSIPVAMAPICSKTGKFDKDSYHGENAGPQICRNPRS